jgi:putative ABC transport system permease protein
MQNFSDTLGQVFRAMLANKLRTFLTMFGIAWGVGSLLVLVGLGEGFRSGQHRNLSTFGNDVVMMWNGTIPAVANQHTGMRPYQLTLRDDADLRTLLSPPFSTAATSTPSAPFPTPLGRSWASSPTSPQSASSP